LTEESTLFQKQFNYEIECDTYPEKAVEVDTAHVQRAMEVIDRVFNRIVVCNEINEPTPMFNIHQYLHKSEPYWLCTIVVAQTSSSTSGSPFLRNSAMLVSAV